MCRNAVKYAYRAICSVKETNLYYLSTRYYNPALGRFLNPDAFVSTGQGLLGNNMFAYCGNNPVFSADNSGMLTVTVGISASATAFLGVGIGLYVTFDKYGMEIQYSYTTPTDSSASTIGLLAVGVAETVQITNKDSAEELRGTSTYLGASVGKNGIDLVSDKPIADPDGDIVGVQLLYSPCSTGVDIHASQTKTKMLKRYSWEEIWQGIKDMFA